MHQHFIKGKKLLLTFKNGDQTVAKYRVSDKGTMFFYDHQPVALNKLRCAGYYKPGKNNV